jgi:hypothetical protein
LRRTGQKMQGKTIRGDSQQSGLVVYGRGRPLRPLRRGTPGCPQEMEPGRCSPSIRSRPSGRRAHRLRIVIPRPNLVWSKPSRSGRRLPVPCRLSPTGCLVTHFQLPDVSSQQARDAGIPSIDRPILTENVFEGKQFLRMSVVLPKR